MLFRNLAYHSGTQSYVSVFQHWFNTMGTRHAPSTPFAVVLLVWCQTETNACWGNMGSKLSRLGKHGRATPPGSGKGRLVGNHLLYIHSSWGVHIYIVSHTNPICPSEILMKGVIEIREKKKRLIENIKVGWIIWESRLGQTRLFVATRTFSLPAHILLVALGSGTGPAPLCPSQSCTVPRLIHVTVMNQFVYIKALRTPPISQCPHLSYGCTPRLRVGSLYRNAVRYIDKGPPLSTVYLLFWQCFHFLTLAPISKWLLGIRALLAGDLGWEGGRKGKEWYGKCSTPLTIGQYGFISDKYACIWITLCTQKMFCNYEHNCLQIILFTFLTVS